jgi:predicted urease superfamily metal-dependent hydrolase
VRIFKLFTKRKRRSLTISASVEVPLKVVVVEGRFHVVGIGELGDKHAEVEKAIIPFFPVSYDVTKVAKELLQKLGVPPNEIDEIMQYAVIEEL